MRRRDSGLIDMTPLLDVVFILLFALILNVNVTKAEDRKAAEMREGALSSQLASTEADAESAYGELATIKASLTQSELEALQVSDQLNMTEEALAQAEEVSEQRRAQMAAYSKALSQTLKREVSLMAQDVPEDWVVSDLEAQHLVEHWLKYQQIGERYLFLDLRINSSDGRIYLDELYSGVNMDVASITDPESRKSLKEELQYYIYDWLDHKAGGYTFIFVSVVTDQEVKRAVVETVFDSLQGLQTSFDKDSYLINRFIIYEDMDVSTN